MNNLICILLLAISLMIFAFSLAIFIDRALVSDSGFSSFRTVYYTYCSLTFASVLNISMLIATFPNFFGVSTVWIILSIHIFLFFFINLIIQILTKLVLYTDYVFKTKINKINFTIITSASFSHDTFFNNKKFIKSALVASYMLCTILIVFNLPLSVVNILRDNRELSEYISKEIYNYQQLFVFSTIPVLLSLFKK